MKFIFIIFVSFSCFVGFVFFGHAPQAEEDTPVVLQEFANSVSLTDAMDFVPPDYSGQESRIGYGPGVFSVPRGMEERVSFWLDIYTKYSTDQGLLHDSEYVHLVYEPVDFTEIMKDPNIEDSKKRKKRYEMVKEAKKRVRDRLLRLSKLSSSAGLEGEDLRYWYMFQNVEGKNKFKEAAQEGRLRFQLGQKDRIAEGIYHSGQYRQQMEDIFKKYNLPIELVRMVFVESSFNPRAVSKVGASGVWQFMRYTARQYMKMDWSVDERNDPLTATEAAAKKLKSNYEMLQSWPLAVTGYNHGPYGIKRITQKLNTTDIAELTDVRKGRFGFASANFYASFLAVLEAERNAEKYYGHLKVAKPLISEKVELTKNLDKKTLIQWFDGNEDKAKGLNLHVKSVVWRGSSLIKKGNFIRVPPNKLDVAKADLENMKEIKGPIASGDYHIIRSGETLSGIALRFGVSQKSLCEINEITDPRKIRAGQKLIIPN
ncbi:MAG: transglycosylase SLT domain-containing protein [Bdellovibrionales bacterium]|nr:transglycosylase SLT domain-containing protein [Bdellovibrionales bacterium]